MIVSDANLLTGAATGDEAAILRQALADGPDAALTAMTAAEGVHAAAGTITFFTVGVWGLVTADLRFREGTRMRFDGWHWGLGVGAATSAVVGIFSAPPAGLVGSGTYTIASSAGAAGATTISFFKNNVLVGSVAGVSLGFDLSMVGGAGTWSTV